MTNRLVSISFVTLLVKLTVFYILLFRAYHLLALLELLMRLRIFLRASQSNICDTLSGNTSMDKRRS